VEACVLGERAGGKKDLDNKYNTDGEGNKRGWIYIKEVTKSNESEES